MARTLKGKARKETNDEKRARLERNRAAQEQCQRMLPAAVAFIILAAVALYFLLPPAESAGN
jgi:hypothetical protein